ncbi:PREDICTED: F-box/LRR-repeat protein 20-like [Fragaria vesca subsp. vesca]|uniref:F-box/LRR-repeat protein 20-like n=1 Tax=Fragaria vesca subsp. vesca TaxID=101020 RepID=UPI0002C3643C|nr:PREDICTED: F-box/LRR-repeat protein 20-like [Fragaria vesca subsp. vesca]
MGVQPKKKSGIFTTLSDDLLGQVVNKVKDKEDRKSFSEVCKQWFKVEGLDRSSLILNFSKPGFSLPVPSRFPNLISLAVWDCKTHTDLEFIAQNCPKLESIMIECREEKQNGDDGGILSPKGLRALGEGCPRLSKVEIYGPNAVGDSGVAELLHSTHNLETLVFLNNQLISVAALRAIGSTSSISSLELMFCYNITDEGLAFLANGSISKTLKELIIETGTKITDAGVDLLRKMCSLEHLELSCEGESNKITDIGGVGISAIRTLKELRLDNVDVSDPTMVALAQNCRNLETLDIGGCEKVTGAGICAFCNHKCLKRLNLDKLKISLSDVERLVLGCPSLKSVVVESRRRLDPTWSKKLMQDRTRKVVKFVESYALDM